jgi:hypothetical protein
MAALESSTPQNISSTVPLISGQEQGVRCEAVFQHYLIFLAGEHFCLFVEEPGRKAHCYEDGLLAILRYIEKHEPEDRKKFALGVQAVHEVTGRKNTKRASTFEGLKNRTIRTRLTKEHTELSDADRQNGIDHLDKFGLLLHFTDLRTWTFIEGAAWDWKFSSLQALNNRWTKSLVKETLDRLRFTNGDRGRVDSQPRGQTALDRFLSFDESAMSNHNEQPLPLLLEPTSAPRGDPAAQVSSGPAAAAAPAAPGAATADVRLAPSDASTGHQQAPPRESASAPASPRTKPQNHAAAPAGGSAAACVAAAAAAAAAPTAPLAATTDVRAAPGPGAAPPVNDAVTGDQLEGPSPPIAAPRRSKRAGAHEAVHAAALAAGGRPQNNKETDRKDRSKSVDETETNLTVTVHNVHNRKGAKKGKPATTDMYAAVAAAMGLPPLSKKPKLT